MTTSDPMMKRASVSFLPPIALDNNSPMYRQLYDWFRTAILEGQLKPGRRVPSTRSLAAELKVSRITVLSAFEQLYAEVIWRLRSAQEHTCRDLFQMTW